MKYFLTHSASALGTIKSHFLYHKVTKWCKFLSLDCPLNVGPIANIFNKNSQKIFNDWILENLHLRGWDYETVFAGMENDFPRDFYEKEFAKFRENIAKIKPEDEIFVLFDSSAEGILFFSYFCNILDENNLENLYFLEHKDQDRPNLGMFRAEELWQKIFAKMEKISREKYNFYREKILQISENSVLRILENNEIKEIPEDFFDEKIFEIIKNRKKYPTLVSCVASVFCSDFWPIDWGDSVVLWRIYEITKAGKIEIFLKEKKMYDGEVCEVKHIKIK